MRKTILLLLFVVPVSMVHAQFSLTPQIGGENSSASIKFNENAFLVERSAKLLPQAAIRFDYKGKQGHGPFIGIASGRSIVKLNFPDPATGRNSYAVSNGKAQFRIEGGYQLSSKPIYFKRSAGKRSSNSEAAKVPQKRSCGSYMARSGCGNKMNKAAGAKSGARGSWVSIQPSLGLAYVPFRPATGIAAKTSSGETTYDYNAANWNTAFISGVGFEFGKNAERQFTLSVNYLKSLVNSGTQTLTTTTGNKPVTTTLRSEGSGWNIRVGFPLTLTKKKAEAFKPMMIRNTFKPEYKCGQYKQCRKVI